MHESCGRPIQDGKLAIAFVSVALSGTRKTFEKRHVIFISIDIQPVPTGLFPILFSSKDDRKVTKTPQKLSPHFLNF